MAGDQVVRWGHGWIPPSLESEARPQARAWAVVGATLPSGAERACMGKGTPLCGWGDDCTGTGEALSPGHSGAWRMPCLSLGSASVAFPAT